MRNYVIPSYTMLEGLHPSDTFCNFLLVIRRTNPARGRHNLLRGLRKLSQSPAVLRRTLPWPANFGGCTIEQ